MPTPPTTDFSQKWSLMRFLMEGKWSIWQKEGLRRMLGDAQSRLIANLTSNDKKLSILKAGSFYKVSSTVICPFTLF